jgi:hypothetical protein
LIRRRVHHELQAFSYVRCGGAGDCGDGGVWVEHDGGDRRGRLGHEFVEFVQLHDEHDDLDERRRVHDVLLQLDHLEQLDHLVRDGRESGGCGHGLIDVVSAC